MLCTGAGKRSEEFSSSLSCSSRQKVSARRIVVKRQVTVATLMVSSSVVLGSCVADIGTRSASEEATNVDETGGISSADGAGGTNGDLGDDADSNQGESARTDGEKNVKGAGQSGEAGATGPGESSGVLPPLGEFDPTQPGFQVFDPCVEISEAKLQELGLERYEEPDIAESGHKGCSYKAISEETVLSISSTYEPFDDSKVNPNLVVETTDSELSGVVIQRGEIFPELACSATLSTVRGVVTVSANSFGNTESSACEKAGKVTKDLI